jgi:polar amino acid transport system substrate-binding protein
MKKLFSLLLVTMMLVGVAAHHCLAEDTSLTDLQKRGKLVLGLDASFPPMGYLDPATGEIVGFDIDVAKAVCEKLGVELECLSIDWDAKQMELDSGNIDCIWNGLSITPERQEAMNISIPYMKNAMVVTVLKGSDYQTQADLSGKRLGLQTGSTAEDALNAAEDFKASLGEIYYFEENATALMDLSNGGLDAVLVDFVVADYYITELGADYVMLDETLAGEEYGIGFRKGDIALTEAVNNALLELAQDGTLAEIAAKWFSQDMTIVGK